MKEASDGYSLSHTTIDHRSSPEAQYHVHDMMMGTRSKKMMMVMTYLIFVIFLHPHILRPGNFTLKSAYVELQDQWNGPYFFS